LSHRAFSYLTGKLPIVVGRYLLCFLVLYSTIVPRRYGKPQGHILVGYDNASEGPGDSLVINSNLLSMDGGGEEARYQECVEVLGFHM
jgi:hypothetical protein